MSFFFSGIIYFKREKKKKHIKKNPKIYKLQHLILKPFPDEELTVLK